MSEVGSPGMVPYLSGHDNLKLLAAKFGALLLPLLLIILAPMLVGLPLTGLFTYWQTGALDPAQMGPAHLVVGLLASVYALLPYAAGGFALAVLGRSTVTAIGGGVGFVLVENVGLQLLHELGGAAADAARVFPAMLVGSVLRGATGAGSEQAVGGTGQPLVYLAPAPAAVRIALYTGAFLPVAAVAFMRQDLAG